MARLNDYEAGWDAYFNAEPYPSDEHGRKGFRDAFDYANPTEYDNDEAFSTYLSNQEKITTGDLSGVFIALMIPVGIIIGSLASFAMVTVMGGAVR